MQNSNVSNTPSQTIPCQETHVNEQVQTIILEHVIYTMTDLNGIIRKVSPAFCECSGYNQEELIGRSHRLLRAPDTEDTVYQDLWQTIQKGEVWSGEIKNIAKNGQPYWIRCMIRPLYCDIGNKIGYIALRDHITREKEIEEHALVDEVTKVYNRRKINQDIILSIDRFKRYGEYFSFVMLDIDYFKTFNDRYGHLVGDEILIQISNFINTQTRTSDIFARWGGDEFAMLIPNIDIEQARLLCEKLRKTIAEKSCSTLKDRFSISESISCSFGITTIQSGDNIDSLIGRTDRALYLAKEKGRNRVEVL